MGDLLYRSVDLQNGDIPEASTIWFDVFSGFNEAAEVRGDHLVIPQKPGRTEMLLVPDRLQIELRGFVQGIGGTRLERQQSWRTASDALRAILDPSLTAGSTPGTWTLSRAGRRRLTQPGSHCGGCHRR